MKEYFHNIFNGIATVFEGMSITMASVFVKGVTVQYPDVDVTNRETIKETYQGPLMPIPDNYRGILDVDMATCTACLICMRACPINCIIIDSAKCEKETIQGRIGKATKKTNECTVFNIDIGKCMFCGLCVEPCPTGAIVHTKEFHMNTTNLNDLVLKFVSEEDRVRIEAKGQEIEAAKKAEKEAKAKAKAAEEAAKAQETGEE